MSPLRIFISIVLLALCLAAYVLFKHYTSRKVLSESAKKFILTKWTQIEAEKESNPKLAILEADQLIDYALGALGKSGTLGEKLKNNGRLFPNLNDLWSAHKLRNQLAHEVTFVPSSSQTNQALRAFRVALSALGVKL